MDPNATLHRILNHIADYEYEEAFYACNELITWLEKDGFAPVIGNKPLELPEVVVRQLRAMIKNTVKPYHDTGSNRR